jgi:hypothetical protein
VKRIVLALAVAAVVVLGTFAVVAARSDLHPLGLGASAGGPHVFLESYGRCRDHLPDKWPKPVCIFYKHFNAIAGNFDHRQRPWGIAYSFNCGTHPGRFVAAVIFPDGDGGFQSAEVRRRAIRGTGFHMETLANNTSRLPLWDQGQGIGIHSSCSWHIRAVEGTPKQVRARIPALPAFYRLNTGAILHEDPYANSNI